jgi:hypothetical protein
MPGGAANPATQADAAFMLNHFHFGNRCHAIELAGLEDVL